MKDEQWIKDELMRMKRGIREVRKKLSSTYRKLELVVAFGDLHEAQEIVEMRIKLREGLVSSLERRKLLLRILNDSA